MPFASPTVFDRCCLRCWALAWLVPGVCLVCWALVSLVESVGTLMLLEYWVHPTGREVVGLFPVTFQRWFADPQSWFGVHALVSTLAGLPLMVLLALPGGMAVVVGLCFWEGARQQAGHASADAGAPPAFRRALRLSKRRV